MVWNGIGSLEWNPIIPSFPQLGEFVHPCQFVCTCKPRFQDQVWKNRAREARRGRKLVLLIAANVGVKQTFPHGIVGNWANLYRIG